MKFKQTLNFDLRGIFSLLLIFVISSAFAQKSISGSVSDETGPLPGVTIVEKGTTNGTTTDFDGNFTITVADDNATLVLSYLGFLSQEVAASSDSFDITMESGSDELDEVVVTGYGTQRKATLTGSIATISGEDLEKSSSPNLGTALAGKVAGLYIDTGNGAPGADNPAIRVRGTNTFNNSSALIVIDGETVYPIPGFVIKILLIDPLSKIATAVAVIPEPTGLPIITFGDVLYPYPPFTMSIFETDCPLGDETILDAKTDSTKAFVAESSTILIVAI